MTRRFCAAASALLLSLSLPFSGAFAVENTWDYSVQVTSAIQSAPAQITLTWLQQSEGVPFNYTVYRKAPGDTSWGFGTRLSGSATSFTDTKVVSGRAYEYRIVRTGRGLNGYGYIQTGIRAPLVESRGKIVFVVDNTFTASLAPELERLERDLVGDGWTVLRRDVARSDSVTTVKALIKAAYDSDPANVRAVFLFGHIAVPYSGKFNPDGHPDHVGAWPADAFYGDMDGAWTDNTVDYTQTLNTDAADAARMSNHPGDGKFDQTTLPSPVELEVGRVDLANMPGRATWGGPATFPSETELLRNYLNKDHAFRNRLTNPPRRAVLGDYFGLRGGEAFAASGFRSFAPLVGPNNVRNLNREFNNQQGVWIPHLAQNDYLLAYGCGPGNYSTMGGLGATGFYNDGTTVEMVQNDVRGVFNLIFGSWLGDWDHEDDFLRAPLATSQGLVSVWSGRPHWFLHPLGLGETIGYVTRLTQNNTGLYETQINSAQNRVHIALMGDPTLRLHPVAPVSALSGAVLGTTASLTWTRSADSALLGYHVYRGTSMNGPFTRLTTAPVSTTQFVDNATVAGAIYMVRAIKLESTPSGSYENPSQGVFWSAEHPVSAEAPLVAQTATPVSNVEPTGRSTAPATSLTLSSDVARSTGSANPAALTIASSSSSSSGRAGAASDGPSAADGRVGREHPEAVRAASRMAQ